MVKQKKFKLYKIILMLSNIDEKQKINVKKLKLKIENPSKLLTTFYEKIGL